MESASECQTGVGFKVPPQPSKLCRQSSGSPAQLTNCPWCGAKIDPGHIPDVLTSRVTVFRYKNGDIKPSRRSLNLLQPRRGVSAEWVLKGEEAEIQYDQTPSAHKSYTCLPLFLEPIESLNNPGPIVMRANLETDSAKLGSNQYWLRIDEPKDCFMNGDFVLIQTSTPSPAAGLPIGEQYWILKRDGKLVFDKLCGPDIQKKAKTLILGVALSLQRHIGVDDCGVFEK